MPAESMPLDGPVDSRVTDSEANDGLTVDPGPREMIPEDDDSSAAGGLQEAEPLDDDDGNVQAGPQVKERVKERARLLSRSTALPKKPINRGLRG
jgi:hypothetical protein